MRRPSLAQAKDHVARAIALCDRLGESAAAAHLQLGLDTLARAPWPHVPSQDAVDHD